MTTIHTKTLLLAAAVAMLATLSACKPNDERTVGQKVDSAVNKTEQVAERAKAAMDKVADEARATGASTADKVADATITSKVKAALAADKDVSAASIDVDTSKGKVTLSGPVRSIAARIKASELAANVKGVTSVNNTLQVKPG
ncbi:MAG: BON domain-containing protein [Ramlibacter sp.]